MSSAATQHVVGGDGMEGGVDEGTCINNETDLEWITQLSKMELVPPLRFVPVSRKGIWIHKGKNRSVDVERGCAPVTAEEGLLFFFFSILFSHQAVAVRSIYQDYFVQSTMITFQNVGLVAIQ